ncbi:methylated-DNA--[protein]-cysteine S-methyltransferase [Thermaerobacter litoralis]
MWSTRGLCALELAPGERGEPDEPAPAPDRAAPSNAAGRAVRDDGRRAEWQALLNAWFAGEPVDVPLDLDVWRLGPFTRAVLDQVRRIPRGSVRTYGAIARALGRPGAARAVGNAVAANPIALLIPCHRVVRTGGVLGAYSGGGPAVKERLLRMEGAWPLPPGRPGRTAG